MGNDSSVQTKRSRRIVAKAGAGALGALIGGNLLSASAQDATPEAMESLDGAYCVVRTYSILEDTDMGELYQTIYDGYVPIVESIDGFLLYAIVYNEETRVLNAIAYFTNKESSDASTEAAADFNASANLVQYFEEPLPIVNDGIIGVSAIGSAFPGK